MLQKKTNDKKKKTLFFSNNSMFYYHLTKVFQRTEGKITPSKGGRDCYQNNRISIRVAIEFIVKVHSFSLFNILFKKKLVISNKIR